MRTQEISERALPGTLTEKAAQSLDQAAFVVRGTASSMSVEEANAFYFLLSIFSFKCFAQASAVLRFPCAESDLFTE